MNTQRCKHGMMECFCHYCQGGKPTRKKNERASEYPYISEPEFTEVFQTVPDEIFYDTYIDSDEMKDFEIEKMGGDY